MDLYSKDDDEEPKDEGEESEAEGGDEYEDIAQDIIDASRDGDAATLASALKQLVEKCGSKSMGDDSHEGKGVLIALGSPKKG